MVSIKEFSFVSAQLNILIHCMSNLRVHRPWSLGPNTVRGLYWKNKCICQSGISLHWKENMMDSSVDEEMTPVECAKVEMFCANTCLYSKHYCYYFHIHRLIFAAVRTWGSHVTHMLMQLGWDTLEQRRLLYQLSKFYKIQGGLVGISIPPAVYSRTRASRAPNAFPFRHIQSSSNVYKYSFYPSSIAA